MPRACTISLSSEEAQELQRICKASTSAQAKVLTGDELGAFTSVNVRGLSSAASFSAAGGWCRNWTRRGVRTEAAS